MQTVIAQQPRKGHGTFACLAFDLDWISLSSFLLTLIYSCSVSLEDAIFI